MIATGQQGLAADINNLVKLIYKTADEVVNNSTTLQNDDHLLFAVAANEIWAFKIFLNMLSGTTPDFKVALTVPSGAVLRAAIFSKTGASAYLDYLLSSGAAASVDGNGVTEGTHNELVLIEGYIINDSTAGNLQLQWAQNAANVSDTTVKKGSYLVAHKLT